MNNPVYENSDAGFTLLEMIIAFLVLSISMGVAVQTVSIASRSIALATERNAAARLVDALQAETLPKVLAAGKVSGAGDAEGMRWELSFTPTTSANSPELLQGIAVIKIYPVRENPRHHDFAVFTSVKKRGL
ncbi:type II secretion system protein [Phyllobacterium myrsinacearum]|nr:type II secretion system protein [Phyllobacterium myrsinacearum]